MARDDNDDHHDDYDDAQRHGKRGGRAASSKTGFPLLAHDYDSAAIPIGASRRLAS